MRKILTGLLVTVAAALSAATSAQAANYDIYAQFGAPVFSYGTLAANGSFTAFAHEPPFGRCHDHPEWDCYGGPEDYHHSVHTFGDEDPGIILMHTGPVSNTVLRFTAPTAGTYTFTGTSELPPENCSGYPCDGTTTYFHLSSAPAIFTFAADNSTASVIVPLSATFALAAGESFDIVSDKNGNYYYDDTLFTGHFSDGIADAAPEPASWAMMLTGFGAIGGALRRRRSAVAVQPAS